VVAAAVHAGNGLTTRQAVTCELFAFAASFVGAALRLRLTDHRRAQVVLHTAAPVIEETVEAALRRDLADLGGCVPVADVMAGRHERAEARLFAS
jgi:urease accessory protein